MSTAALKSTSRLALGGFLAASVTTPVLVLYAAYRTPLVEWNHNRSYASMKHATSRGSSGEKTPKLLRIEGRDS